MLSNTASQREQRKDVTMATEKKQQGNHRVFRMTRTSGMPTPSGIWPANPAITDTPKFDYCPLFQEHDSGSPTEAIGSLRS